MGTLEWLQGELGLLRERRATLATLTAEWRAKEAAFREAHAELLEQMADARAAVAASETAVRDLALTEYAESGAKTPTPGVGIKVFTVVEYDEAEALQYARAHLPAATTLNRKVFESLILRFPAPERPAFVTVREEPRAQIATDLDKALGAGTEAA